jgi:DNA-binding HxlR family transcriptional regulator
MSAKRLPEFDCAVAQALGVVGELWSLMVLRNVFNGMHTFAALQENLGISSSVLSARLKTLCAAKVLARRAARHDARSVEYHLTARGQDLYPVLIALMQWGEQWMPSKRGKRLTLVDKRTGEPIHGARVLAKDGRVLQPHDVELRPGPGIDASFLSMVSQRKAPSR